MGRELGRVHTIASCRVRLTRDRPLWAPKADGAKPERGPPPLDQSYERRGFKPLGHLIFRDRSAMESG